MLERQRHSAKDSGVESERSEFDSQMVSCKRRRSLEDALADAGEWLKARLAHPPPISNRSGLKKLTGIGLIATIVARFVSVSVAGGAADKAVVPSWQA